MTKLTIIDTGWNTSARQGTKRTGNDKTNLGEYICNAGNAITLNSPGIKLQGGTNASAEPNPSSNESTETSHNTFKNETYTVPFKINVKESTERNLLKEIHLLNKTNGVKLLYPSDTTTNLKMATEILGRTDTKFHGNEVDEGIPVLACKATGIKIDDVPSSIKYAITGTITLIEEKVEAV